MCDGAKFRHRFGRGLLERKSRDLNVTTLDSRVSHPVCVKKFVGNVGGLTFIVVVGGFEPWLAVGGKGQNSGWLLDLLHYRLTQIDTVVNPGAQASRWLRSSNDNEKNTYKLWLCCKCMFARHLSILR